MECLDAMSVEDMFNKIDTNKDCGIDRAEWHQPGYDNASFDRMDTNHDGKIDWAEWAKQWTGVMGSRNSSSSDDGTTNHINRSGISIIIFVMIVRPVHA